jgi:SNF2 family DNA or RNA helicase
MALSFKENASNVGKEWISLIYDKNYVSSHTYNNPMTVGYSALDLEFEDSKHIDNIYIGYEALILFNKEAGESFKIPIDLDFSFYNLYYYKLKNGVNVCVFSINVKKINHMITHPKRDFKQSEHIPQHRFLCDLMNFHRNYERAHKELHIYSNSKLLDENFAKCRKLIIDKTMEPVLYHHDPVIDDPHYCTLKLTQYQKANIKWMIDLERYPTEIQFNIDDVLYLGSVVFNRSKREFTSINNRQSLIPLGGAVIDEVGCGKTICAIITCVENKLKKNDYISHVDELILKKYNHEAITKYKKLDDYIEYNDATVPIEVIKKYFDDDKFISDVNKYIIEENKEKEIISLASYEDYIKLKYINDDKIPHRENLLKSNATLIICTPDIVGQWQREIESKIKLPFKIICVSQKSVFDTNTYKDFLDADFVIVPFTFFNNPTFVSEWAPHAMFLQTPIFAHKVATNCFDSIKKKNLANFENLEKTLSANKPLFPLIKWRRLIVDEFHESVSTKYIFVKNILPHIHADNRWILTGTPFINPQMVDEITRFIFDYPDINFIKTHRISIEEYITNDEITTFIIDNLFRRNTKISTKHEYSIPTPKEIVMKLKFTLTERRMFSAFLANPNNRKDAVFLRQLCCYFKLADETKYSLSTCRTMKDVESAMINHYKVELIDAFNKTIIVRNRVVYLKNSIIELQEEFDESFSKIIKKNNILSEDLYTKLENEIMSKKFNDFKFDKHFDLLSPKGELLKENDHRFISLIYEVIDEDIDTKLLLNEKNFSINKNGEIVGFGKFKNICEEYKKFYVKYIQLNNILNGKVNSYRFYQNTISRIKKISGTDDKDHLLDILHDAGIINLELEKKRDVEDEMCPVCLCPIEENQVGVTRCGHIGCFDCLKETSVQNNRCPSCNVPINPEIDITLLDYEKEEDYDKLSLEKRKHLDLINDVGTKLATLIKLLNDEDEHTIIFSQWNELLLKIGKVLTDNSIKNVYCQGNVYQRDLAIRTFCEKDDVKVIMLSSDSSAAGTNLTKATCVIFIDPVYGDRRFRKDTEYQAIGRTHRMGQTKQIKIYRLIIRDSIEEEIYNDNIKADVGLKDAIEIEKTEDVYID